MRLQQYDPRVYEVSVGHVSITYIRVGCVRRSERAYTADGPRI